VSQSTWTPKAGLYERPAILPDLPSSPLPRLARPTITAPLDVDPHRLALPNSATRFGVSYVRGQDDALSDELLNAWQRSAAQSERFLDLFGVEWIVVPSSVAIPAGFPVLARAQDWSTIENTHRRPRAFFSSQVETLPSWDHVLETLFPATPTRNPKIGLATIHLVGESTEPVQSDDALSPCPISEISPEHLSIQCHARKPGFAVLLSQYDKGWSAKVDGRPTPIRRADLITSALPLTLGSHTLTFEYKTPLLRLGTVIALSSFVVLILLGVLRRRGEYK
jgi:hypothetical protein